MNSSKPILRKLQRKMRHFWVLLVCLMCYSSNVQVQAQAPGSAQIIYFANFDTSLTEPVTAPSYFNVFVSLTGPLTTVGHFSVYSTVWPGLPASQTATPNGDYEVLDSFVTYTIQPNTTRFQIRLLIFPDMLSESEESFLLRVVPQSANLAGGFIDSMRIHIKANDFTPRIRVGTLDTTIYEGAGQISLPVNVSGPISDTTRIDYAFVDSTALYGIDFQGTRTGTLRFLPTSNSTSRTSIYCNLVNDVSLNGTRTFSLKLSNPRPAGVLLFPTESEMLISITDNDPLNPLGVSPSLANTFKIYPNPAREQIWIRSSEALRNLRLYQSDGKLVATWPSSVVNDMLDVSQLARGIYSLQIETEDGQFIAQRIWLQ
jgi:hypothetical protein